MGTFTPLVVAFFNAWTSSQSEIWPNLLDKMLTAITLSGLFVLMNMRKTVSSIHYFPPTIVEMLLAFEQIDSKMFTVGSRALDKHFHRVCITMRYV